MINLNYQNKKMSDRHTILYGILKTPKEVYKLTKERISIGRNRNSQIVINNNTISKEHAMIEFDSEFNATIKDLNSSNGTYVNGERLKFLPLRLKTGDKITFGKFPTEYIFESFNQNMDSKTEADMDQYMLNGNNLNNNTNENKVIYDQKINLVNENELSFARMNHFQNNNNSINLNRNNLLFNNMNNINNGSYNNNLKNGTNNNRNFYYEQEDNNINNNNVNDSKDNSSSNKMEQLYKNKIEELEKQISTIETEKEEILK